MANTAREIETRLQAAARSVRDPVPGVLEGDGVHAQAAGYDGLAHGGHDSRNTTTQPSGDIHAFDSEIN
jgi:hypothetical protein